MQRAAAVGVAEAVLQQIIEQLHQAISVAKYHRAVRQRKVNFQVTAGEALAECAGHNFKDIDHVDWGFLVGQGAFVGHGKLMQIVHQLGQRADFRLKRGHGLGGELPHAVLNRLQLAAQHRQRGAQLVRNVGHKIAAHLLVFFQRAGELVEVLRQLAQFILAAGVHAGREITRRQLVRAFHQALNRRQQAARQREGGERRKQGRKRDNQPAGLTLLAVKVDVGVARQPLDRRGDNPAHRGAVRGDGALCTVRRYRRAWANEHAHLLIYHPELGAPAVRRHARPRAVVVIIVLQRSQDLKHKAIVIAQKTPVTVQAILFAQRVA